MRNEIIERELERLVEVARKVVPQLIEIRVFGSYNNGNWDPEKSDVDVFVETGDERYSSNRNIGDRIDLREQIRQRFSGISTNRFSIHLFSFSDVKRGTLNQNNGYASNFIISAKNGRLLYPLNLPALIPQVEVGGHLK